MDEIKNESLKEPDSNYNLLAEKAERFELMLHLHSISQNEANVWATEAVKHVALVSLAGLAGAFALKGGQELGTAIYMSALAFAIGSALSVASMFCFERVRSLESAAHRRWLRSFVSKVPVDKSTSDIEESESDRIYALANKLVIYAITATVLGGSFLFAAI